MNDTSAICDIRGSAKTLRFEPGNVVVDSVTDNTPVWTGNELEPKKIKNTKRWTRGMGRCNTGMQFLVLNFTLKQLPGSLGAGTNRTDRELS